MDHVNTWKENQKSPYFGKKKQIINHPGEVRSVFDLHSNGSCPSNLEHSPECQALAKWQPQAPA